MRLRDNKWNGEKNKESWEKLKMGEKYRKSEKNGKKAYMEKIEERQEKERD